MSNIPNNIKKMWEEAAAKKIDPKKPLHRGNESLPKTGPKMVNYGKGGNIHGNVDEKGNLKN